MPRTSDSALEVEESAVPEGSVEFESSPRDDEVDGDPIESFLSQAGRGMAAMEDALYDIEARFYDMDAVQTLCTEASLMKNNALTMHYSELVELAQGVEVVLSKLLCGDHPRPDRICDTLWRAFNVLDAMIPHVSDPDRKCPQCFTSVLIELRVRASEWEDARRLMPSAAS
jgi:chemotaxis protein histidine kinase CheA